MKKNKFILLLSLFILGCMSIKNINEISHYSITDADFLIMPHIIKKENNYFLKYQIDTTNDVINRFMVSHFVKSDTLFFIL